MPEEQDTQKIILSDPTWLSLSNEIVDLENQLKAEAKPIDTTELKEAKAILSEAIDELNKKLGKRDTIERSNKVIEDLEDRRDKTMKLWQNKNVWSFGTRLPERKRQQVDGTY